MKKIRMRTVGVLLAVLMVFGQTASAFGAQAEEPVDATTAAESGSSSNSSASAGAGNSSDASSSNAAAASGTASKKDAASVSAGDANAGSADGSGTGLSNSAGASTGSTDSSAGSGSSAGSSSSSSSGSSGSGSSGSSSSGSSGSSSSGSSSSGSSGTGGTASDGTGTGGTASGGTGSSGSVSGSSGSSSSGSSADSGADSSAGAGSASGSSGSSEAGSAASDGTGSDSTASSTEKKDVSGEITTDEKKDVTGDITVEEDKNDDNVEIKKNDKPYLALGVDLTAEQQATVLALMGIDQDNLSDYDVVYVNNTEEHEYLGSYIDSSKIGSKSLSSVVIVEREDGNGINISTNNISYCTVGMYKNALATAGIENADIIVAAPFAISGTAALVGVFKAYTEMTGDEVEEENVDAALNELVVTGNLESSNEVDSDEIENLMAYVKQAVVEHDMSDEGEIREAIAEGCEKFGVTLTEEEISEIVQLMQKISELDLDLDSLLNSAQSIYDRISGADGGFWAKVGNWLSGLIDAIKGMFS